MGFIDTIYKWLGVSKDARRVSQVYTSPYKTNWVQYRGGDYTTADISTVNACCRIIGDALASAEPRLYNSKGNAVNSHPFLDSLMYANDLMNWDELLRMTSNYIALTGACYWFIDWGTGKYPAGYYPLAGGSRMKFKLDGNGNYSIFEYDNNGKIETYNASDILIFRNISSDPNTPLIGRPIAAGADYAIQELIGFHDTRMSTIENGSRPDLLFGTEERLSKEETKAFLDQFEGRHKGAANQGKSGVLPYGLKVQDIGFDIEKLMYILPMDDVKREICEVFRVPPEMLGTLGKSNKSNVDAALGVFITQTMRPYARIPENTITGFMRSPRIGLRGWKFNLFMEVPKNDEIFAKTLNTQIMSGVVTPNEGRRLMNLPPIDGGDYQFVPVNVARVDTSTGEMVDQVFTDVNGMGNSKPIDTDKKDDKKPSADDKVKELMFLARRGFKKGFAVLSIELVNKLQQWGSEGANLEAYDLIVKELNDILSIAEEKGYGVDYINDKIKKELVKALLGVK